MSSCGLVTLVSHLVGLPSTWYGLPLTMRSRKYSLPSMPMSSAGWPGQMSTTSRFWARAASTIDKTSNPENVYAKRLMFSSPLSTIGELLPSPKAGKKELLVVRDGQCGKSCNVILRLLDQGQYI